MAVAARDPARAAAAAEELGVERVLRGYPELIADPEVEVVYNPLANGAARAVEPGRDRRRQARAQREAVRQQRGGGPSGAGRRGRRRGDRAGGLPLRAPPGACAGCTSCSTPGELGELRRVETHFAMPAPPDDDPRWSFGLSGGALMDLGCYCLHAQRMLAPWAGGVPRVVAARAAARAGRPERRRTDDVELEFPGGATGWRGATWPRPAGTSAAGWWAAAVR